MIPPELLIGMAIAGVVSGIVAGGLVGLAMWLVGKWIKYKEWI